MKGWSEGIKVMISNLMNNAIIHGQPKSSNHQIKVTLTREINEGIILIIEDNGPGIAIKERELIKERFKTGSSSSAGSGLGLALVDQQAKLHNGKLEIETSELGGAKFILFLVI
jgi:signal transduction histidine kinase